MGLILDKEKIYQPDFPGDKMERVAIRLVKETPFVEEGFVIKNSDDAVALIGEELSQLDRDMVCVINMASNGKPINCSIVSIGTINNSLVSPANMLKTSILSNAAEVIMLHNHPSGELLPSDIDILMTKKLLLIYNLMNIELLDHIIIGANNTEQYYSMRENDLIDFRSSIIDRKIIDNIWFDNVAEKREEYDQEMTL